MLIALGSQIPVAASQWQLISSPVPDLIIWGRWAESGEQEKVGCAPELPNLAQESISLLWYLMFHHSTVWPLSKFFSSYPTRTLPNSQSLPMHFYSHTVALSSLEKKLRSLFVIYK